jgi:hypothetical protein
MDKISDYYLRSLILGETFDSEEKLKAEAEEFYKYIQNDITGKAPFKLLVDFAEERYWPKSESGFFHSSDLKAVMIYFEMWQAYGNKEIEQIVEKRFWDSPEGKREMIANTYIGSLKDQGLLKPTGIPDIEETWNRFLKNMNFIPDASGITTTKDFNEWAVNVYIPAIKKFQREFGLKPCGSRDCTKFLPADRPKLKYCPDGRCKEREKSARYREKNPDKAYEAQHKFHIDLYTQYEKKMKGKKK